MEIVIVFFLIFIYFIIRDKSLSNPLSLYIWIWIPIMIFSASGINGLKYPSFFSYFIIFCGSLLFVAGNLLPPIRIGKENNSSKSYEINYKLLIIFEIISIIVLLPQALTSIYLMKSGYSLGHIHTIFISDDYAKFYGSNRSYDIFFYLFTYPTLFSGVLFASYDMWFGKRNKLLQIVTVILVAMRVIQFGGRAPAFYLAFSYVMGGFLRLRSKKSLQLEVLKKNESFAKTLRKMIPLLSIALVGMGYSVLSRLVNGINGVSNMLLEYFAACPVILSEKLDGLANQVYTCGLFTLFGFFQYINKIISTLFKVFGFTVDLPLYQLVYDKALFVEQGVDIGTGISNAFVTPFFYFYSDGWLIGVIVFSLVWGALCKKAYYNFFKEANLKTFYFLLFFLFSIGFSMTGCWLSSPQTALALPFFYLFVRRKKLGDGE